MSSAIAIIRSLSFLESSAIVTCEIGRVTIDVTQTGNFTVDYCQPRQPEENTNFKLQVYPPPPANPTLFPHPFDMLAVILMQPLYRVLLVGSF